jgi:predicted metal-dependent enzyme (double-stranded beta helix superfamily)
MSDLVGELATAVRGALRAEPLRGRTARAAAAALQPFLGRSDLLRPEHCEPRLNGYARHVLHIESDGAFSIVSMVWLPGQSTPPHDHIAWCSTGIFRGVERETRFERDADGRLRAVDEREAAAGSVDGLALPSEIHRVVNPGPGLALTLHIYGADVGPAGTSVGRFYPDPASARSSSSD